jgi:hypothetical protein
MSNAAHEADQAVMKKLEACRSKRRLGACAPSLGTAFSPPLLISNFNYAIRIEGAI